MLNKILSLIAIPLGIVIALKYFKIYDISQIASFDIVLIGAIYLILMQLIAYIMVHSSNEGTTIMGKIIKSVLAVPGILFLASYFYPLNLPVNLEIIIALVLFLEGLYGLH